MTANDQSLGFLSKDELRLASRSGFDIPKPLRFFFIIVAAFGVSLIVTESLMTNRLQTIQVDKIIHFMGYGCLAIVFALSLRPIPLFFAIIFSALGGVLIEYLQLLSNRDCDVMDMIANALGLITGCSLGVTARLCWQTVSREITETFATKNLLIFEKGETILKEEQKVKHLMIIKSGRVEVKRNDWNRSFEYGKGGIIGMMAAVKGEGQYTTIRALEKTILYKVPIEKLHKDAARREAPVAIVLDGMADAFMEMAGKIQEAEKGALKEPPTSTTGSKQSAL